MRLQSVGDKQRGSAGRQSAEGRTGDERRETNLKPSPMIAIDTLRDTDSPASRLDPCSIGSGRR